MLSPAPFPHIKPTTNLVHPQLQPQQVQPEARVRRRLARHAPALGPEQPADLPADPVGAVADVGEHVAVRGAIEEAGAEPEDGGREDHLFVGL